MLCARHSLVRKNGLGDLQKGEQCVHVLDRSYNTFTYKLLGMPTWTSLFSQQSWERSCWLWRCRMTSVANGHTTFSSACLNFWYPCKSPPYASNKRHLCFQNFTSTITVKNVSQNSPLISCGGRRPPMVKTRSAIGCTPTLLVQACVKWARALNTTQLMTMHVAGTGERLPNSVSHFAHCPHVLLTHSIPTRAQAFMHDSERLPQCKSNTIMPSWN